MILHKPFEISSRLLPALRIADGWISLEYVADYDGADGRDAYHWLIDIPAGEFSGSDLKSGCQGGSLQEGFASLLSFLGAAAESYRYARMKGENARLFPAPVVEWAYQHSDEISMLGLEIEESKTKLIEE